MNVFYLKFNRTDGFVLSYAQRWIEIIKNFDSPYIYFLVDKDEVTNRLKARCNFLDVPHEFIKSQRDSSELQFIVKRLSTPWYNAGYAHMTTFLHARDHGFNDFWNIDGDDITLYAEPARIAELMRKAESYAKERSIHAFSIDVWMTIFNSAHWSFGATYIDNSLNWMEVIKKHIDEFVDWTVAVDIKLRNVDWIMNYISRIAKVVSAETFYCENLYTVMNNIGNTYEHPLTGLRYWHDGELYFPVVIHDLGMGDSGVLRIPNNLIKLDIDITAEECKEYMQQVAGHSYAWHVIVRNANNTRVKTSSMLADFGNYLLKINEQDKGAFVLIKKVG